MAKKPLVEASNEVVEVAAETAEKKKAYYFTKGKLWDEKIQPLVEKYADQLPQDFIDELTKVAKPQERTSAKEEVISVTERLARGEITLEEAQKELLSMKKNKKASA